MSDRAARLVERLPVIEADAIVVTNLVNLRYLTGYTGSNGVAVIGPETRAFLTDFRYQEQSAAEVDPSFDRRILTLDLLAGVSELLPAGADRLAIEHHRVRRGQQCAGNSAQERRLAGAVGADDGHGLALLDRHIDIEQRLEVAVESRQILRPQQRHDTGMPI